MLRRKDAVKKLTTEGPQENDIWAMIWNCFSSYVEELVIFVFCLLTLIFDPFKAACGITVRG
jgi:hypothetical protein